jgi:hypothetical protein
LIAPNGQITPLPSGVLRTNAPITYSYILGDNVELTATPDAGFEFLGWTVSSPLGTNWVSPELNPLPLQLDTSYTVSAKFRVPGDDFEQRVALVGEADAMTISNVGATRETGEPFHAGLSGEGSVWFVWIAPRSGRIEVQTVAEFSHALAIYSGDVLASLTAQNSGIGETVSLGVEVLQGMSYPIAIDSTSGLAGPVQLSLQFFLADFAELDPPVVTSGNQIEFGVACPPGAALEVWESPDLVEWTLVDQLTGDASGRASFTAPIVSGAGNRFYRVVVPGQGE